MSGTLQTPVVQVCDLDFAAIQFLAARFEITLEAVAAGAAITHSYWGAPEAGIVRTALQLRGDTPIHSALHELCHIVCMSGARRTALQRDAGGDAAEECAVCFLQVLLADQLPGFSAARCLGDMDVWGYSFRQGSAGAWFDGDGREARDWLHAHGLIDAAAAPTWRLRS